MSQKSQLNSHNIALGLGGFVLGLILGALILGRVVHLDQSAQMASLQQQVTEAQATASAAVAAQATVTFRTVNEAAATSDFFLVGFQQAEGWLTDNAVAMDDEVKARLQAISEAIENGDIDPDNLETVVKDETSEAHAVLKLIYETILQATGVPETAPSPPIAACLGVQDDVYVGISGFLYLQMPQGLGERALKISPSKDARPQPTEWQKLNSPLPNTMLWASACYEGPTKR
ncbi:MAG: hypothetical protein NZ750_11125 [Anaerolineae bacterium]|nr:hypothetical protein [Anaerolineae bacterium]MDW8171615.1 hypothetical protein [Anaerolineae bacterium]